MTFDGDYRPGRHAGSALHAHLVLVARDRHSVLDGAILSCYQAATRKACADSGAGLHEPNGEVGHVHVLMDYPPNVAVSALVNSLKGVPARRLRSEFTGRVNRASMRGHFWSLSCFAASCVAAPLCIIRQHIEQQRPA